MASTLRVVLGGETNKFTAAIWNAGLTEKLSDVEVGVEVTLNGVAGQSWAAPCLVLTPLEGIVYDRYTDDIELNRPWNSGPSFDQNEVSGNPSLAGSLGMRMYDSAFNNVSNSVVNFEFYWIGEVNTATPFNKLHLMNEKALTDFSKVRLVETDENGNEIFNYSQYIVNMLQLGFKIPDDYIAGDSVIRLDILNTGIVTPIFSTDRVAIDLGQIPIPAIDSSVDLTGAVYELFTPFIADPIELDYSLIGGKTLKVEYVLDLYVGDVTINVYTDTETAIVSVAKSIGRNVPIKLSTETNYTISGTNGVINGLMRAYVRHSKAILVEGSFTNLISKSGQIGDYKGYLEVENIELAGNMLANEKDSLINLLNSGVIIK